jgi:DNA-binding NarL/FixJ family response regulator
MFGSAPTVRKFSVIESVHMAISTHSLHQEPVKVTRILIADDHPVVRAGSRRCLESEPGITEIGEVPTGADMLELLDASQWDLLLLDIHLSGRYGIATLRDVITRHPQLPVLVMSALSEAQYARLVLREGAKGYLCKSGNLTDLLKAVRVVLAGRRYISNTLAETMASDLESRFDLNQPLHDRLSARERQVFVKLAAGDGVSAIAQELVLSVKTVSTYRARILEKMGFKSNAEITGYALQHSMITQTA